MATQADKERSTETLVSPGPLPGSGEQKRASVVPADPDGVAETIDVPTGSSAASAPPIEVTREHAGRYVVADGADEGELGRGGIGRVFAALDRHLQREVAIKELLTDGGGNGSEAPDAMARFLREARVTGQLEHPNIVPVYELGRRANGALYYTMRVVRGRTLAQAIAESTTLEDRLTLVNHFSGLCQAIAYAHSRGVVHRDVKPQNVMIGEFGETVVLDWGTSKLWARDASGEEAPSTPLRAPEDRELEATREGSVFGTPVYMSPEQALGRVNEVDERSDVWALGVVLYTILAGRPPFGGRTFLELRKQVASGAFTPLSEVEAGIPRELAAVAERALRKVPSERYATAKEMAKDVEAYQAGARVGAYEYSSLELVRRFLDRHRAAVIASAVGVAALVVLGLVSYRRVVAARDRALLAEERSRDNEQAAQRSASAARRSLSEVLVEKAALAEADGDAVSAEILAAHALDLGERPDARGIVLAAETAARPTPLATFAAPAGCDRYAVAPHAAVLSCARARSVRAWNVNERSLTWESEAASSDLVALAISSDASALVTASAAGVVSLFVPRAGKGAPIAERRIVSVSSLAMSPDGRLAAAGTSYGVVVVWEIAGGGEWRLAIGQAVTALAFAPRATHLVTGGELGAVSIWNWRTGKELKMKGHTGTIRALAFAQDGRWLASGGADRTVRLWDAQDGLSIAAPFDDDDAVTSIAWSADAKTLAIASADKSFRWIDPRASGRGIHVRLDDDAAPLVAFMSKPNELATVTKGSGFRTWSVDSPANRSRLVERGNVLALDFDPKTRELLGAGLGRNGVSVWDLASASCSTRLPVPVERIRALAVAPGGVELALGGSGGKVFVWDLAQRIPIRVLDAHHDEVRAVGFSKDGRWLASAGVDRALHVFEATTGVPAMSFDTDAALLSLAFVPNAPLVVTGDREGMFEAWDLSRRARVTRFKAHDESVLRVAVSPDGALFASAGGDRLVRIWNAETKKLVESMAGHEGKVTALDFSADGALLASGSEDKSVRIWHVASGRELARLGGHDGTVRSVRFAPGRALLASGSDDGTIRLNGLEDLVKPASEILARTERRFAVEFSGTRVVWKAEPRP